MVNLVSIVLFGIVGCSLVCGSKQELHQSCQNSCTSPCSVADVDSCPPGMFCMNDSCECGTVYPNRLISCDGTRTSVLRYNCVTLDSSTNLTVVGACLHSLKTTDFKFNFAGDELYHQLPVSVYELDDLMCSSLNHTGLQCGHCQPGLYPLAYSYSTACVPCPASNWNWLKYVSAAYLPLTVFCAVILFFNINITSSHLFAVVYYCQTLSTPSLMRSLNFHLHADTSASYKMIVDTFVSLYGMWNLDFFRPFYPSLCLRINALHRLALEYLVAMYPLLAILISYLLIKLHDKKYRIVLVIWSPFRRLLSLVKGKWEVRTSIIDAFATFYLLSNIKILSVSFDLLVPTKLYFLSSHNYTFKLHLFSAADIEYFGKDHLPYAILALIVLTIFVVLPVIIFSLYPFKFFQQFLNLFPFRWYILHTFVDTFQGCYTNGTEPGTRDCRWFVTVYFVHRLLLFLLYSQNDNVVFLALCTLLLLLYSTLLAALQPFKQTVAHYNEAFVIFLQALSLLAISVLVVDFSVFLSPQYVYSFSILTAIFGALPLGYAIAIIVHWIYKHKKFGGNAFYALRASKKGYKILQHEPEVF